MSRAIETARESARTLLAEHQVTTLPVPVEKIAKSRGIAVQYSPLDPELSGMAYVRDGLGIIGVNALHHPNRQRFTIAHELAHHMLHRKHIEGAVHIDKSFNMLFRDSEAAKGTDLIEITANAFASELLMPRVFLDALVGSGGFDIDDEAAIVGLAKKFKVSTSAMRVRLFVYG